jgi:hypothetical protein
MCGLITVKGESCNKNIYVALIYALLINLSVETWENYDTCHVLIHKH